MKSTITAIATPHGVGAISIVRVSGLDALKIASKITNREEKFFQNRFAHLLNFYDNEERLIDKGILIYFKNPNSFTGEDIVEFQTHGGVIISQSILKTVIFHGGRLATAGEFSKRAFLNGKIDLTEAEAISAIIEAKSEEASRQLSKQLNGDLKRFVDEVRNSLINILAHSEVTIDYAEEDLPEDIEEDIVSKLVEIEEKLRELLNSSKRRVSIFDGFKIAIVGRPNVGKSSLLNGLLNYERAIVSDIAGTTRDSVEENLIIGTHLVKIVDTAGIREAENQIEKIGIERSVRAIQEADIVLAIFDSSEELKSDDYKIIELLKEFENEREILILFNKSDLTPILREVENFKPIKISTKNGDLNPLLKSLENILSSINNSSDGGIVLSSIRQIVQVEKSLNNVQFSREPLENGELELFSYHIEDAINSISEISKPFQYSEMLDEMFSNFCLGK